MLVRFTLKTFRNAFSKNIYAFSTATPEGKPPVFKFPRRWNLKVDTFNEVFDVLAGLTQYKQFATFLKDNLEDFTDEHIGSLYQTFGRIDLEPDNHYYDFILPITKQYIKKYTFQDAESLSKIIQGALVIKVQDDEFWDLILHKLHKQKCARYLSLQDVFKIAEKFSAEPKLNEHPVMSDFAKILGQQKSFFALYSRESFDKAGELVSKINNSVKARLPQQKLLENEVKKIEQS